MNSKRSDQQKIGNASAQAVIEFAIALPLLLLLILGVMDLGRMFYIKMILTNAAREGANYLAYFPEDANNGYVDTFAAISDEASSSNVEVVTADVTYSGCCTRGQSVEVTITKMEDLIFDSALQAVGLLGGPVQITSTVKMMVQ
jgi:Flp pilus assembly protein TadG